MKRFEDLVVDGETEDGKGRKLVAGLRLLRAYGKVADRALKVIAEGGDIEMVVPYLEPFDESRKNYKAIYSLSNVPVHTGCRIPTLPDYSGLSLHMERIKPTSSSLSTPSKKDDQSYIGFTLHVRGPVLGVFPRGRVREIACDEVVGSVWWTKTRVSWNFRNMSDVKTGKAEVCKRLAETVSNALIKLCSDGSKETWHSQANHVRTVLRDRCRARLSLDGHAERLRSEIVATMNVEAVHAL